MAYIDRDAALNYQNEVEPCLCRNAHTGEVFSATRDDALVRYLEQIPAADVRPVVKAAWKETFFGWECTACGEEQQYARRLKFCPNCGADMRTGAE